MDKSCIAFSFFWALAVVLLVWLGFELSPLGWGIFVEEHQKDLWGWLASLGLVSLVASVLLAFNMSEVVTISGPTHPLE